MSTPLPPEKVLGTKAPDRLHETVEKVAAKRGASKSQVLLHWIELGRRADPWATRMRKRPRRRQKPNT